MSVRKDGVFEPPEFVVQSDGYVHIILEEFGWSDDTDLYGQEKKLSYLLTQLATANDCTNWYGDNTNDELRSIFEDTRDFQEVNRVIQEYCNCNGIYIDDFGGYIDHQSFEGSDFLSIWGVTIEEFLFNSGVNLIIDNDNH